MYLTLQVICITSTGESVCMCVCLCCSVAVKKKHEFEHSCVQDRAHSLRGFRRSVKGRPRTTVVVSCVAGWVITALRLPCLNAAPPSGESVVLPVKVTPKNTQLTDRKQEVYRRRSAVSDRSVLQGRDSVAHHWSHHDQQRKKQT